MEELNIRNFKLINGDNILALVSSNNSDNYLLEKPVSIFTTSLGGYIFSSWFPFSEQKRFTINKQTIVCESNVVEEIKEEYIKYSLKESNVFTPPLSNEDIMSSIVDEVITQFEVLDTVEDDSSEVEGYNIEDETIH